MNDSAGGFSPEQQSYLQGFALGSDVARKVIGLPIISGSGASPGASVVVGAAGALASGAVEAPSQNDPFGLHRVAQDAQVAAGGKLVAEEVAKRNKNPRAMWDELRGRAARGEFPSGTDVFMTKFHGLFYVAPAQDAYMCRLRFPGGAIQSWQMRGIAELTNRYANGCADVTTRANLQIREIGASDGLHFLTGLTDLGVINFGAGADNIRNVTASPLSGLDPQELIETLPLAREMHHYLVNHHELFGLPRKFNIAFDGGGAVSALEDTNDIGFTAVRLGEASATEQHPAGVYFLLTLGGITGHQDFARPTGVVLKPSDCIEAAAAVVRVFLKNGDRTDRKKARLKYLLDRWGFDRFLEETEKELGRTLLRMPQDAFDPRPADDRWGHVGVHPQKQAGLNYVGVVLPVGRLTSSQMVGLAEIADSYGSGEIRLTVWQNLLITNIQDDSIAAVQREIEALGLNSRASSVRAGLVACTGSAGCKYAAAPTKANALTIADYVEERLELDTPVNIHLTGCHHSCAQHYIGDIGLIAANVEDPDAPDETVEGYHLYVGGGHGDRQAIGNELARDVPFRSVPAMVVQLLQTYLEHRLGSAESFGAFTRRVGVDGLRSLYQPQTQPA